jgi:hypothetical protein
MPKTDSTDWETKAARISNELSELQQEAPLYEAAGATCEDVTDADGSGWANRDGREEWDDYERRKWVWQL